MVQRMLLLLIGALLLGACGTTGSSGGNPSGGSPVANQPTALAPPTTQASGANGHVVNMAMPYIPNVQFSPFYVAAKRGYYAAEGIDVAFDYNFETDVVQRAAQETVDFGLASGDSVLLARAQGLPIVTVATLSQRFPVVFFSKAAANIKTPADMKGQTVGIPGHFGASYIGLLALLYANKMQESDINVQDIGFAQVAALQEDKVRVVSGYGNNEPVQLAQQGVALNVIAVADSYPLASDGLIASQHLIDTQPDMVRGFIRATLHGMQDVIDNPDEAFQISLEYIPEAQRGDTSLQRKVLQETLAYWQSPITTQQGLGYTDQTSWQATHQFMRDSGLLKSDVDISKAFTNTFLK